MPCSKPLPILGNIAYHVVLKYTVLIRLTMADNTGNVQFLTIEQFKSAIGATSAKVLKNHKTGKLFLSASNGESYKVEQAIDSSKEMKVLVADNDITEACLVNVSSQAEEMFTI